MPKFPVHTLAWSPVRAAYELYQTRERERLGIVPESPAWFAWLDQVSSFAFVGKRGHYTARKEAKQRGDRYWSAYLTTGEHLTKKYLGKSADLTLARLEHIAGILPAQREDQLPPPETRASASADKEVDAARHAVLAQQRHPLHPLLATKLHMPHPRTQLVPRAHLVERLRQGLKQTLDALGWPAIYPKRVTFSRTFPASFLQGFQRTACHASAVGPPVVNERGPRHPQQPVAHPLWVCLLPQAAHGFQKNGGGQVLGLLPVAHLAIDIVVDQAKMLAIQRLKSLRIQSGAPDR